LAIDEEKSFDVNDFGLGMCDSDGNRLAYITTGVGSPVGNPAPVGTHYFESSTFTTWRKFDTGDNDWIISSTFLRVGSAHQLTTDGNARGNNSIDLQKVRAAVDQVCSGVQSFLGGGANNKNAANNSFFGAGVNSEIQGGSFNFLGGGNGNIIITGNGQVIVGGQNNNIDAGLLNGVFHGFNCDITNGLVCNILGGSTNLIINGIASQILGGAFNSIDGDGAVICGGTGNVIQSGSGTNLNGNAILGGQNGLIPLGVLLCSILNGIGGEIGTGATASTIVTGNGTLTSRFMEVAHGCSVNFGSKGSAQHGDVPVRAATTDGTPTVMDIFGGVSFGIPADRLVDFSVRITAYEENGGGNGAASFWRRGLIENRGGTTALVGAIQTIGTDIGSNAGLPPVGWGVSLAANNTNDTLDITVTGAAGTNINWKAYIEFNQVGE